jgi:hypothetical protein
MGRENKRLCTEIEKLLFDIAILTQLEFQLNTQLVFEQRATHIIFMRALVSMVWASRLRFHIERLQAALPACGRGAASASCP